MHKMTSAQKVEVFCVKMQIMLSTIFVNYSKTKKFDEVICTVDTHDSTCLSTKEDEKLLVIHCQKDTWWYLINKDIYNASYEHK